MHDLPSDSPARPLHVLIVHNRYQQYGGEDAVVDAEIRMLEDAGHYVSTYFVDNEGIDGAVSKMRTAAATAYNPTARREVRHAINTLRPDVVHVHNFFPRLSPAIFDACHDAAVPSVMTVHNFRLACANAFLFRDGQVCEKCLTGNSAHAILHRCYRGSLVGSATVAAMIAYHRAAGTWRTKVGRFIALTEFSRVKLIESGLPADRMMVKPNCLPATELLRPTPLPATQQVVFVGRLNVEKGVDVLVDAWRDVDVPLLIIGDGPERAALQASAPSHVRFLGHMPRDRIFEYIAEASMVVIPSLWYENFPMAVVEALAMGRPVLASDIGALREIVPDAVGRRFRVGDRDDLARVARTMLESADALAKMAAAARAFYDSALSPARNIAQLVAIYRSAIADSVAV